MKNIIIIGAGGHAKVVADIFLKRKEILQENIKILGFLDDDFEELKNEKIFGIPILGKIKMLEKYSKNNIYYIIAIGNNYIRKTLYKKYSDLKFAIAVHPTTIIGNNVTIDAGTVIMANTVINPYSQIGKNVILNTSTIIEHDTIISDFVHVSPGAVLCGNIIIKECVWIGAKSVVKQNIIIGKNSIIGAGSVVVRDVADNCTIVGNPAKILSQKKTQYGEDV